MLTKQGISIFHTTVEKNRFISEKLRAGTYNNDYMMLVTGGFPHHKGQYSVR